jgi:hypothetical protein
VKEAAYATNHDTTYSGEKRNWSFEQYYHAHQEAYYDLEMYGEIITESKKVTEGIVIATPTYFNNFSEAAQYIASTLNITLSVQHEHNRNIGSVQSGRGKYQGDGKERTKGGNKNLL